MEATIKRIRHIGIIGFGDPVFQHIWVIVGCYSSV